MARHIPIVLHHFRRILIAPAEGIPPNDNNVDRQHSREYNVSVVVDSLSL